MCVSPRRTGSTICCVVIATLPLLLLISASALAKPNKDKSCRDCQLLEEVLISGGKAILDELTTLAEGADGAVQLADNGVDILAELPLTVIKTLSKRGIAVTPAKDASQTRSLKDGEDCATAVPIEAGVPYTDQTTYSTPQAWCSFTPDESGFFTISLAGSEFDTILSVFDACNGNELAYNDDDGWLMTSELSLSLEAGTTYIILIEGFWGDYGEYTLFIEQYTPTVGESCYSAIPAELDTLYEGTLTTAVPETWYAFTPAQSGHYVISLKDSELDTILTVYDRCGGPEVAYNDDTDDLQSCLDIYLYEGTTYLIQVSGWMAESGSYQLRLTAVTPPAHDIVGHAIEIDAGEAFEGSTYGATCTLANSECSLFDSRDVWHSYVPSTSGYVRVTLDGTGFDTTLVVFDEFRGTSLACNDDVNDCSYDSGLCVNLTAGQSYLIRVAGYDGMTGPYTLTVEPLVQSQPETPQSPQPADCTEGISTSTVILSWNNDGLPSEPMASETTLDETSRMAVRAIYGRDDRLEEYQIEDTRLLEVGDATIALIERSALEPCRRGYQLVDALKLSEYIDDLCPDEPYQDQPTAGLCSGFLVAPDLIVTAGHCQGCGDEITEMAAVFGYVMKDANTPATVFDCNDVYFCQRVVAGQSGTPDWSLVRLDRPVTGHTPVRVRRTGFVPEQQPLLVVGHPIGLPRKYDSGGTVRENWMQSYFSANLDTFGGNSGSAVFNLETMAVEGILVAGNEDFTTDWETGCTYSSVCPDSGCPLWEDVTRVTLFSSLIPSYTVLLGTDPNDLAQVDTGGAAPQYTACDLEPDQTYYWQIIAENTAGKTPGPVWSFTTAP